jgi:hypothetical protein
LRGSALRGFGSDGFAGTELFFDGAGLLIFFAIVFEF